MQFGPNLRTGVEHPLRRARSRSPRGLLATGLDATGRRSDGRSGSRWRNRSCPPDPARWPRRCGHGRARVRSIPGRARKRSPKGCGRLRFGYCGCTGGQLRAKVGDHLIGRFCPRLPSPTAGWAKGDPGGFQIGGRCFATNAGVPLDSPQRPAQPPKGDDLLFLLFVQDVTHIAEGIALGSELTSWIAVYRWPVFR